MNEWYEAAIESLLNDLEKEEKIIGLDFLQDFVLENREDYFQDLEFEDIDQFVTDQFDDFQGWLRTQAGIKVLANGKWIKSDSATESSGSDFSLDLEMLEENILNPDDIELLDLEAFNLSPDHFDSLKSLYARLAATRLAESKYKCAFRLAKCGELNNDIPDYERIQLWINASEAANEAELKDKVCDSLYEAAYHYQRISKFREAAQYFERSAESLVDHDPKRKHQILKNARTQYQMIGDHDAASKVFLQEKDLEYKSSNRPSKLVLFLYKITSNYGESPSKVAWNILFVWVIYTAVFCFFLSSENLGQGYLARLLNCFYYTVVTFTTLGYGDITPLNPFGKIASGFLAVLGLLYTSLFMVTVVRRYARV
ncbi:potassium channel family protein [Kushneria marisflavi]|uniref:Uncharacterized protein n=1 Tax=Kushneria marisflavi TaxID=157779 RepID=A0A240UQ04_9GAMM|nr:potassium channel family protein [Kushneria marisflavi]ART63122.1 hypothetical protein B9H00_08685 [Kushneria marisflavi]RKD84625.1 ion channel [Kushneria marisflavi]